ncbi:unnamed protein product, partial [Laminaria digitata]
MDAHTAKCCLRRPLRGGRPPAALRGSNTPAARVVRLPPLALCATDAGSLMNAVVPVITGFGPDNCGYSPTIRVANVYVAVAAGTEAAAAGRRRRTAVGGAVGATTVGAIGT